jgi:hypothetical protein
MSVLVNGGMVKVERGLYRKRQSWSCAWMAHVPKSGLNNSLIIYSFLSNNLNNPETYIVSRLI